MSLDKSKFLEELKNYDSEDIYKNFFLNKYQESSYEDIIRTLFEDRMIPFNLLEMNPIIYLWKKYDWARTIISENIDEIISNFDYVKLSAIIELAMSEKDIF